ncbi:MAG: hypothetical protein ABIJ53_03445, partial [Verrucomicrobiota bacterium]
RALSITVASEIIVPLNKLKFSLIIFLSIFFRLPIHNYFFNSSDQPVGDILLFSRPAARRQACVSASVTP